MLFNSIEYFLLVLVTIPVYWICKNLTARLAILLVSSTIFYASWEPAFLILIVGTLAVNFLFSLYLNDPRKFWLTFIVLANLASLGFFKYTNFAIGVVEDIAAFMDVALSWERYNIILPLGISFFTFQLISYAIDVKSGKTALERNPLRFAVFISFFPQLIAGPICRANEFLPQLRILQPFRLRNFVQGFLMLAVGLFLKVAIADNISPYVEQVYDGPASSDGLRSLLATLGFAVQILCDFWGYSTMALGTAHMFGLTLPANFDLPYIATTMRDFWRRWHITLSFWLRDYLYIWFGGNRQGSFRTGLNLVMVMAVGGLWHGASYNFIIWGLIHGGWLLLERYAIFFCDRFTIPRVVLLLWRPAGWLVTMTIVTIAWVFFRAETPGDAMSILQNILEISPDIPFNQDDVNLLLLLGIFALLMFPLHALNQAGLNTNFYKPAHDRIHVGETVGVGEDGTAYSISPEVLGGRFGVSGDALVIPGSLKIVVAFWLFIGAFILGSEATVPFIYFQF